MEQLLLLSGRLKDEKQGEHGWSLKKKGKELTYEDQYDN